MHITSSEVAGFNAYNYGSAAWLTVQAIPLIISPSLVETLLSSEVHKMSPLEEYFSRSLGLALLTLALLSLILTGFFQLTSSSIDYPSGTTSPADLYATPTLIITVFYHAIAGFYTYGRYGRSHQSAFLLGTIGSGAMAAMGLWCILFGRSSRISSATGADKRTSGWPFGNSGAYKKSAEKKLR